MKRLIWAFIAGSTASIAPYLSIQLSIFLHKVFGVISAPTVYNILEFMGPAGAISTEVLFYVISGVLVSVIDKRHQLIIALLVAAAAPAIPESLSLTGLLLSTYILAVSYAVPSLLVGILLGNVLFMMRSIKTAQNQSCDPNCRSSSE